MAALPLGVSPRDGAAAIGIGLLSAAAFPPLALWPLALVAPALFLWLIRNHDAQTARNLGLVFGFVHALGTMYWFFAVFAMMAIPLVAIMTAYFGLLATLVAATRNYNRWVRTALVAVFAVGIEWLRGDAWYLRFPWYTPAHALAWSPAWIAPAHWVGTYGISLVIWWIAAAGAFVRPPLWTAFLLLPACSLLLPSIGAPDHRVLLLQSEDEGSVENLYHQIPAEPVDLTVMPELAYLRSPSSALSSRRGPAAFARKVGSPVVFGAVEGEYGTKFLNVAVVIDRDGTILGTFAKQQPVPLMLDGTPGTERPVFPMEQGTLGVAICYDLDAPAIAASLVHSGATVLVVPTFDAMSWTRIQHVHHEMLLRVRAVENDRWVLRAVSSGRSEVIDPHGVPSAEGIEIGQVGFVVLPYAHRNTKVLGGQTSMLGPVAGIATGLFVVFAFLQQLGRFITRWRTR